MVISVDSESGYTIITSTDGQMAAIARRVHGDKTMVEYYQKNPQPLERCGAVHDDRDVSRDVGWQKGNKRREGRLRGSMKKSK